MWGHMRIHRDCGDGWSLREWGCGDMRDVGLGGHFRAVGTQGVSVDPQGPLWALGTHRGHRDIGGGCRGHGDLRRSQEPSGALRT